MRHTQQTTSRLTTNLINSEQPSSAGDETAYQRSLCYDGILYVCMYVCMYVRCCGVSIYVCDTHTERGGGVFDPSRVNRDHENY